MKERKEIKVKKPQFKWQKELVEELNGPIDDRKIIWYVDSVGGNGKSTLSKYLTIKEPEKYLCCSDLGNSRDCATVVEGALNNGWEGHGFIVDLTRTAEASRSRIYTYLEQIKNGHLTATKYKGGNCLFNNPHVVVFANWCPEIMTLSEDRWDIRIINNETKEAIKVKIHEVLNGNWVTYNGVKYENKDSDGPIMGYPVDKVDKLLRELKILREFELEELLRRISVPKKELEIQNNGVDDYIKIEESSEETSEEFKKWEEVENNGVDDYITANDYLELSPEEDMSW